MKKQLISAILIIAMVITMIPMLSMTAFAASDSTTIDVSDTSPSNLPTGVTYDSGVFTINGASNPITVIGTTTQNTIVVADGTTVTLVLSGASITAPGGSTYSPIDLQGNADVTLTLADGTTSTMSAVNANLCAGIHAASTGGISATLTINGAGSLYANGASSGAGIGGAFNASGGEDGGNITISGGTVNATGGNNAAGIGGGGDMNTGSGGGAGGNIIINGDANVTATGGHSGAGIGGGDSSTGGNITISGSANVIATGGFSGAGIGGGVCSEGGNITINGGTVTASTTNGNAAGIGGGANGDGGNITINGGTVTATGDWTGAGIGGGDGGTGGNISISPSAVVMAASNGIGNSAIQAVSGSGSVINAALDNAISASGDSYLKCNENILKLPAYYKCFAFNAAAASPIKAYSDSACNSFSFVADIITSPDSAVNIPLSATIDAAPASVSIGYLLTVNLDGGNGSTVSGSYVSGAAVSIDAGTKSGCVFSGWTNSNGGTFDDANSASTTFTMPGNATTITANWTQDTKTYTLTVNLNGGNGSTASGSYASGTLVNINAGTKHGYTFNGWTSSNGGTFDDANCTSTTFTMPGNATTITANWARNSTGGSGGGSSSSYTPPENNNTIVIVDGENYYIGTENKNGSSTSASVDQNKLTDKIAKASESSSVIFPVSANTNVTAQLVVKNIEDMAKKDMTLTVQTGNVSYILKTSAIDTAKITASLGTTDSNAIPFNVSIANSNVAVNGTTVIVSPVEFTITATYNGKTVNVDTFNSFVDRIIEITADQARHITTAVAVEPNGSLRHVPTKVAIISGKYCAVINSLTNSTYTVISHPYEFKDITNHWAKDTINNMGSRMVVNGVSEGIYQPDRNITRAEFAAIIVKALGLAPGTGKNGFSDVETSKWYSGYIETANVYGIIQGYNTTTFGPNDLITREQAMTMIANAMKITGLKSEIKDSEISSLFEKYSDGAVASAYAKSSIAACLKTGIVTGRGSNTIAPKYYITRAEVAVIVQSLLQKSNLI